MERDEAIRSHLNCHEDLSLLLIQLNEGSERALAIIFDRYYLVTVRFGEGIIENRSVARELAADAFLEVWKRRTRFSTIPELESFVKVCVKNACINHLKAENRKISKEREVSFQGQAPHDKQPEERITPESVRAFYDAVNSLPVQQKQVITLFLDGYKTKEIAEFLHLTVKTVQNHRLQARKNLQEKLAGMSVSFSELLAVLPPVYVLCFLSKDLF